MLISGKPKTGTSLYGIVVAADLFAQGKKIIFFCGYPAGVEEFMKIVGDNSNIEYVTSPVQLEGKRAIVIKPGDEELFSWVLDNCDDIESRIIFLKNFELHSAALAKSIFRNNIIITGDLDASPEATVVSQKDFATKIFFSKPKTIELKKWQEPEKYRAMIVSGKYSGLTMLN